ncbi:gliding motility-associated ABC transporter substrate-binding protein GldG [Capnocytophaga cynodegmi]|uniref:Putative Gliding-associated ABC transporter substrate-binding component GldG n=1 Tax=Capnocytophaga cynodegmi TaxID=28189 RepID=A0A0B7HAZ8_9FLAO|nr:gliding motility-associated ABC transporter substrate-binding protein GldG [Capnocytophaga cynodegmi]CEN35062.1 putative Gliding-associated ABC transporter substrate-binding component GldG [Capnocytophaga cynodegmi]CEN35689.1 putative Gliding-associated ABC transporter substrate-binding component GldG [Capnocytophaga cynodegmi]
MKVLLNKIGFKAIIAFLMLLLVNFLASKWHNRWDLTKDKRYTLSETTQKILLKIHSPIVIDVLLKGNIPTEFKKLQTETLQLLEEYSAFNNNIHFNFVNPLENEENTEQTLQELINFGLNPLQISQNEAGKSSIEYIFPWAIVNNGEKSEKVALFVNKLSANDQERVQNSVQRLEYGLTDALHKLTLKKRKKIAMLKSNGTLEDIYIADFLKSVQGYYRIAPFTLDSVSTNPEKTLKDLNEFDLLIVAKPTEPFSDPQKQVIDQFVMKGGRVLWLIDNVKIDINDLYNPSGTTMAMPVNLNLTDLFFQYGFRINFNIINDLYSSQIVIATGEGSQTRYMPIPWVYNPMILSKNNHLINNHLDATRLQFANSIDTLKNGIRKTILLSSSPFSKSDGTPREVSLKIDVNKLDKNAYKTGNIPTAVLLEGEFTSVYKNRIRPIDLKTNTEISKPTKMIVVSDGDIIKNDISDNNPLELGFDKWTNKFYDNKAFLQNAINYLLDDTNFLVLRNKKVQLAFLDREKVAESQKSWKIKSIIYPLLLFFLVTIIIRVYYQRTNVVKK